MEFQEKKAFEKLYMKSKILTSFLKHEASNLVMKVIVQMRGFIL